MGHPVVVYGAVDGVFDGVIYRHAAKFDPSAPFAGERAWLCVISRYVELLDARPNAEHVMLVMHDTDYGSEFTVERASNCDLVCTMSEWHRQHVLSLYPFLYSGQLAGPPPMQNIDRLVVDEVGSRIEADSQLTSDRLVREARSREDLSLLNPLPPFNSQRFENGLDFAKHLEGAVEASAMFDTVSPDDVVEPPNAIARPNSNTHLGELAATSHIRAEPGSQDGREAHFDKGVEVPNDVVVSGSNLNSDIRDGLLGSRAPDIDATLPIEVALDVVDSKHVTSISGKRPVRVIQNGIEPSFFEGTEERKAHSFTWSSAADRGLDVILEWWPSIREMWPDATLDCYYGFHNMKALTPGRPWLPPFMAKVEEMMRQPGVTNHGRIGQKQLAREMMRHQFWLYPSMHCLGESFHETFCITALEAAAGGCIGIFPSVGALTERPGVRLAGERMSLEEVLLVLKALEEAGSGQPFDPTEYTWRLAAEAILAAIPVPELAAAAAGREIRVRLQAGSGVLEEIT